MTRRRIGLRLQFILLIVFGLSLLFIIIALVVSRITANNLKTGLVNNSKSFASLATKPIGDTFTTYKDSGTIRIIQQVQKFTELDDNIKNVGIVDLNGQVQYLQQDDANFSVKADNASSFEPVYVYEGGKLARIVYPYIEDTGAHRYSIAYDVSYSAIDRSISQLRRGVLILAALALLASIAITYLLISKLFLGPVGEVSKAAKKISEGDLDTQITPKRNDEIGDLAVSVNSMADALEDDIRKLKEVDAIKTEFMMIASHNLRTPLTIIQGYLDTLLLSKELPPGVRDTVEVVAASGSRLSVFAEDILTVSKLEAGENVMNQREKVDIRDLLTQIGKDFLPLAKEKNLQFESDLGTETCELTISRPHFRAAVWNLLDNALKFTNKGKISLSLRQEDGKALISIADTGAGIAPEEVPKLFTKFHRGTSTLQYEYEGTGIGLYLTKLIIDQHGGVVGVDTKLGQGTTFLINLPLQQEDTTQNNKQ